MKCWLLSALAALALTCAACYDSTAGYVTAGGTQSGSTINCESSEFGSGATCGSMASVGSNYAGSTLGVGSSIHR